MKNTNVTFVLFTLLLVSIESSVWAYDIEYCCVGGTKEEGEAFSKAMLGVDMEQPELAEQALTRLLKEHPNNRPALLMRADLFIAMGRPTAAKADLDALRKTPEFNNYTVYDTMIWLAEAKGDKKGQLAGYKSLASIKQRRSKFVESCIAELEGNAKLAEALLQEMTKDPTTKLAGLEALGELKLRQGDYAAAARQYEAAIKDIPKVVCMDYLSSKLAMSLWADGRRKEVLDITTKALGKSSANIADSMVSPIDMALAVFTLSNAGVGTKDANEKAIELAKERMKLASPTANSLGAAASVIVGEATLAQTSQRIRDVLKVEPNLEWALWSALYLGLWQPTEAGDLLKLLPKGSIQHRIAEVERKARSATQPTSASDSK